MDAIIPVILSGGSGSRLWPLSRAMRPKQFLGVTEQQTLFQLTLARVQQLDGALSPIIVANHEHRFLAAEQARVLGVDPTAILLEPTGRNTAPAIAVAALQARADNTDPLILVMPSDHIIQDIAAFNTAVALARDAASDGLLVTFGIVPDRAETGYGYVMAGDLLKPAGVHQVARFIEKPDLETAQAYVASGQYCWNSGMFMFRASVFLEELAAHRPDIREGAEKAWHNAHRDLEFIRLDKEAFAACPSESVDYAVMEKTRNAAMVSLDAGWNDVGAWPAVWESQAKDDSGNAGRGDFMFEDASGCYVHADHRLVTLLGTQDLFVIETSDAVLVGHKDHAQGVKKIVERLQASKRKETDFHREVFRPWGSFDSIDQGEKYQVKRITVAPGAKLSLQYHHHRAEHWVVVSGTGKVRIGEHTQILAENQSVYIPVGETHSLENPGSVPLELIEVQSGSYLGEDDIVRLEDIYGRA
ncbi:MAG: mannose-1-phosphate guanylyltransferase/mannose-6-phosphate isomerase [Burkholderiaceae bacterium]|nr:mannose-1-phosphate guanylyltransferase/mannose-6-phosphate isomerase [Burkholderiaceae bacterium]